MASLRFFRRHAGDLHARLRLRTDFHQADRGWSEERDTVCHHFAREFSGSADSSHHGARLPSAPLLPAPTLLLVGDVVQTEQLAATPLEAWNLATEPLPQAPVEHEVFDRALTRD